MNEIKSLSEARRTTMQMRAKIAKLEAELKSARDALEKVRTLWDEGRIGPLDDAHSTVLEMDAVWAALDKGE